MKIIFTIVSSFSLFFAAHGQQNKELSTTKTLPNGVVVHDAIGVEGCVKPSKNEVKTTTIQDWNLAQCIDALSVLEIKYAASNTKEKVDYDLYRKKIEARITFLKTKQD